MICLIFEKMLARQADFITGDLEDDTHLADAMGIWTWALHAADGGRETW